MGLQAQNPGFSQLYQRVCRLPKGTVPTHPPPPALAAGTLRSAGGRCAEAAWLQRWRVFTAADHNEDIKCTNFNPLH